MIKFNGYGNGEMSYEYRGKEITLLQDAYIVDNGLEYEAHAEDNNGHIYRVIWEVKQYFIDNPEELTDEQDSCEWEEPVRIENI